MNDQRKNPDPPPQAARRLPPCPASPNCVSTQAARDGQRMDPLQLDGAAALAMRQIEQIVGQMPGVELVRSDEVSLRFEFRSRFFGFVDDVEFIFDEAEQRIDFRSASRLGKWDLGANRRRMETIRAAYLAATDS